MNAREHVQRKVKLSYKFVEAIPVKQNDSTWLLDFAYLRLILGLGTRLIR